MAFNSMKTVFPWDLNHKWFMLQRSTDRLDSRGKAEGGSIFQINFDDTKAKGAGKYGTKIVMENIGHERQKVSWEAGLFIGLDDDVKALLEAVDDPKERLFIYTEHKERLCYAKGLKIGDYVGVTLPGSQRQTFGEVKYIGPVGHRSSARYFGIELSEPPLDETILMKEDDLFTCIQNRGVIIPMNYLNIHTKTVIPTSHAEKSRKYISSSNTERMDDSTGVGGKDLAKPPMVNEGDIVMAYTKMQSGYGKCTWVMGKVLLIRDGKVAVEVDKEFGSVSCSWNGFHKHEKLLSSPSKQTVLVQLSNVKTLDQYEEKTSKARQEKKESMPKSYAGAVKEGTSHHSPPCRDDTLEQLPSNIKSTCNEMQENVRKTNNLNEERCLEDFASPQESMSYSHSFLSSDERVSSLQDIGKMNQPGKAVRRSSSLSESKDNSSHPPKQGKQSGGKDNSSGNFMTSIKNVFSGKRGDPPKLPFKPIHVEILCKEKEVWAELLQELHLAKKWKDICIKEEDKFLRVEKMLKEWWDSLHEDYNGELQRFTGCLRIHKLHDLADHIQQAPENAAFDVSIVGAIAHTAKERWKTLASHLPIEQKDLNGKVNESYSPLANLHLVFDIWQQKEAGCLKIWKLIDACRKTGLHNVEADIEQGLSEYYCRTLSRQIEKPHWKRFGEKLSISHTRLDAFGLKFHNLAERVFHMLCYWSMTCPLNTDKIDVLAEALRSCKEDKIANELQRDLYKEELQITADLIDTDWKRLASHLSQYEVDDIMQSDQNPVGKALLVLKIWKRRQPLKNKKLKKCFYTFLLEKKFYKAARQLYDGLDDETVVELANKLCFEWTLLAKHFGYAPDEISRRFGSTDQLNMSFIMFKEWIDANKEIGIKATKTKLYRGLKFIGRDDLVEWLDGRLSDTADEKKHDTFYKQADTALKSAKFDRILMEKIEKSAPDTNENGFMDLLHMPPEAVRTHIPQSVNYESNPVVAVLSAWKKKMTQEGYGEGDIIRKLKDLFTLYGMMNAVAVLPDLPEGPSEGSSVDGESYRDQSQGAVGGESAPAFNVNSMVEVDWDGEVRPGVIQWIGTMQGLESHGVIAGIELEDRLNVGGTNGWLYNFRYFRCDTGKGLFLPLNRCRPDSRFLSELETNTKKDRTTEEDFGGVKCDPVDGHEKPREKVLPENIGLFKGIQGDHNSCYMDVTLYSMFAFNDVFDAILNCDDTTKDVVKDVKDALRRTIVNPLRRDGFVRADYVLHFRDLLNCLSSMEGLRTEEKDPEEFIHALLQELLNAKPFLAISQGTGNTMESFVYQIFLDKKDYLDIPTVQDLLHVSFLESDLKLTEVPECLIVQLPRYGKKYKLFDWIIPSLEMDIRLLIRDSPRPCSYCGVLAFMECRDCTPEPGDDDIIQSFCKECFKITHKKTTKKNHQTNSLVVPKEFAYHYQPIAKRYSDPYDVAVNTEHLYEKSCMELFSVVCIETSHYVAFVKAGSGDQAEWVFFDSMADRRGDQHGYNVPEVTHLMRFAAEMERKDLIDALKRSTDLSKYLKRLLSDAYICFYRPVKSKIESPTRRRMPNNVPEDQDVSSRNQDKESKENWERSSTKQQDGGQEATYANMPPRYPHAPSYSDQKSAQMLGRNEYARQQNRNKKSNQESLASNLQTGHQPSVHSGLLDKNFGTSPSSENNTINAEGSWQQNSSNHSHNEKTPKPKRLWKPSDFPESQNLSHSTEETCASQPDKCEDMEVDQQRSEEIDGFQMIQYPPHHLSYQEGNTGEGSSSGSLQKYESQV